MNYKDLQETMVRPSQIIANNRPFIAISDAGLQDQMEYLEEEIMSRGGFESMGKLTRGKYDLEREALIDEIAYRN